MRVQTSDMKQQEIYKLIDDIETFQNKYSKILRDEDRERIEYFREKYMPVLISGSTRSKFGQHYNLCEWSSDNTTDGAYTCICYSMDRCVAEIRNLLKWYTDNTLVNL